MRNTFSGDSVIKKVSMATFSHATFQLAVLKFSVLYRPRKVFIGFLLKSRIFLLKTSMLTQKLEQSEGFFTTISLKDCFGVHFAFQFCCFLGFFPAFLC